MTRHRTPSIRTISPASIPAAAFASPAPDTPPSRLFPRRRNGCGRPGETRGFRDAHAVPAFSLGPVEAGIGRLDERLGRVAVPRKQRQPDADRDALARDPDPRLHRPAHALGGLATLALVR